MDKNVATLTLSVMRAKGGGGNVGVFFMSSCFHTAVSPLMMCSDNRAKHLVHDNKRTNFVSSNDKMIKGGVTLVLRGSSSACSFVKIPATATSTRDDASFDKAGKERDQGRNP